MKRIIYQEHFQVSAEEFLACLKSIDRLEEFSKPVFDYKLVGNNQSKEFETGKTYLFNAKMFSLFPIGIYKIQIVEADEKHFYTESSFMFIKDYKRWVDIKKIDDNNIVCTHQVDIEAGWKTPLVYMVTKLFQKNIKKKWLSYFKKSANKA